MKKYLREKLHTLTTVYCLLPFAEMIDFQNSKGKYESRKILGFARKMRKIEFLKKMNLCCCLYYFEVLYFLEFLFILFFESSFIF
jgi:hypothetical protein